MNMATVKRKEELAFATDIVRSPTYVPHLAKALIWLTDNHRELVSGIYNINATGHTTMYNMGQYLAMRARRPFRVAATTREKLAEIEDCAECQVPGYTVLDCTKFNGIYPVKMPTWQEGLDEFLKDWDEEE
jgi:dTDP-4-dehydrorhamnose reductase